LPPLPNLSGNGPRVPLTTGVVLTPSSWVSSSLTPTLVVPDASGPWTFSIDDFSQGASGFGPKVYAESGPSSSIPLDAGLEHGRSYVWTATNPEGQTVLGTFAVDVQLTGVQQTDGLGHVTTHVSSGEASFSWSAHAMDSMAGQLGFGLSYRHSHPERAGTPSGWLLRASTSSPFERVQANADGSVTLVSTQGVNATYRPSGDGSFEPVRRAGELVATDGFAPVLRSDEPNTWTVTTKFATSVFRDDTGDGVGNLVSVVSDHGAVLSQRWAGGLLRTVTDPVSGRTLDLRYGGDACPNPPSGFVAAPAGMVCEGRYSDGSTAAVHYVALADGSVTIGRLADHPTTGVGGVVDLGYDAAGRIARTRSPLVAQAAASGVIDVNDTQYWGEVDYDDRGRVASVTEPASEPGGVRCSRRYDYLSVSVTEVFDTCANRVVMTVEFDPATFFTTRMVNSLGQQATFQWDLTTGQLLSNTTFEGLVTTRSYDNGRLVETRGPTKGSLSTARVTRSEFDQVFDASGNDTPMVGLDVTYWRDGDAQRGSSVSELGPAVNGVLTPSLLVNWTASPVGQPGAWGATMTGAVHLDAAGVYQFRSGTPDGELRVAQTRCVDDACEALQLPAGEIPIEITVAASSDAASMDIAYAGPDTGDALVSIPSNRLRPGYGYMTTTEVVDPHAVRSPSVSRSITFYDDPSSGFMSRRANQAGITSGVVYEPSSNGGGGWGRQTAAIQPAGNRIVFGYWGDREVATAPCPGATPANQGGAAKTIVTPAPANGPSPTAMQWFDNSGRLIASQMVGGSTSCTTFDEAGRVIRFEEFGLGAVHKVEYDYTVGGNPLIGEVTTTLGDEVTVERNEIDLAGRSRRSTDRYGIVTETSYDVVSGEALTQVISVPTLAPITVEYRYDTRGVLTGVAVDGRTLETVSFNADGTVATVQYGNGLTARTRLDDQMEVVAITFTTPDGTVYEHQRTMSAGGHISGETLTAGDLTSSFTYTHDSAGRLIQAAVTKGLSPVARTWAYTYDINSNRLSQLITDDGDLVGDYSYRYDTADRLVDSTDPAVAGGLEYDERGNATRVGANRFTYDAANNLVTASDGTTTVDLVRGVGGGIIARTIAGPEGQHRLRFASAGITLDDDGTPLTHTLTLTGGVTFVQPLSPNATAEWQVNTLDDKRFVVLDDTGTPTGVPQLYEPFGTPLTTPDALRPGVPNRTWQAGHGHETFDLALPFIMLGARVYVPALGRFVQLDPQPGGSANGYDYAGQNPVNLGDPSGRSFLDWLPTIVGGIASVGAGILLPPLSGFFLGAAVGAAIAAYGYAATWGVMKLAGVDTEFSLTQLGITAAIGFAAGGISAKIRQAMVAKTVASAKEVLKREGMASATATVRGGTFRGWRKYFAVRQASADGRSRMANFTRNKPANLFDQIQMLEDAAVSRGGSSKLLSGGQQSARHLTKSSRLPTYRPEPGAHLTEENSLYHKSVRQSLSAEELQFLAQKHGLISD
jgi:RHS repeat-associated protein